MNDTQRLDWIQKQDGMALVSDDAGRWAVVVDGIQNLPDPDEATDISTTFFIEAAQWQDNVRDAIDAGIIEFGEDCNG